MKNMAWHDGKEENEWKECVESAPLQAVMKEPLIVDVIIIKTPADPTLEEEWIFWKRNCFNSKKRKMERFKEDPSLMIKW